MQICPICKEEVSNLARIAETWLIGLIKRENPNWVLEDGACPECINYYYSLQDVVEVINS